MKKPTTIKKSDAWEDMPMYRGTSICCPHCQTPVLYSSHLAEENHCPVCLGDIALILDRATLEKQAGRSA